MKSNVELRKKNMLQLLQAVRVYGPVHKRQLQKLTGLSWGTVSTMIAELIQNGFLQTQGKRSTQAGRHPEVLDISGEQYLTVGVDVFDSGISLVVADLKGRILHSTGALYPQRTGDCALETMYRLLDDAVQKYRDQHILGMGFALQGVVDVQQGLSVQIGPPLKNWYNVPLQALMHERYGLPVTIAHDPDCLMKAQQTLGSADTAQAKNALLLRMEKYGIGMGVLLGGQPYLGSRGKAGEIGKTLVCTPQGENKLLQDCVCAENLLAGQTEYRDIEALAEAARSGGEAPRAAFDAMGLCLGRALVNAINLFNPELIVLDGFMSCFADLFMEKMEQQIRLYSYDDTVKIKTERLSADAPALGAALLAAESVLQEYQF